MPRKLQAVKLGAPAADVTLFDPTLGAGPIQNLSNVNLVTLTLSNHPVIIGIPPL